MLAGKLTRRMLLSLGSLSSAVAAAVATSTAPGRVLVSPVAQKQYLERGSFRVSISGCEESSKDTVSVEIDDLVVETHAVARGGDASRRTYRAGVPLFGQARFTFRVPGSALNEDVARWIASCAGGRSPDRRLITLQLLDEELQPARTYHLQECFPTKFDPGDYSENTSTTLAELTIQIGRIELA